MDGEFVFPLLKTKKQENGSLQILGRGLEKETK
jgi:hypothetical protein